MLTVVIFIAILSLLVFVHEWGHFVTARRAGMKVYEFGFGFPPRAIGWYRDPKTKKWVMVRGRGKGSLQETVGGEERVEEYPATLYSINWLPLGGFVKIKGESGEKRDEPDSFVAKPIWQRLVVLVAGVTMNFVLAALLLGIGFMIGLPADVSGEIDKRAIIVDGPTVMIEQVQKDSPAEKAGLQFGDRILQLNGEEVKNAQGLSDAIKENGEKEMILYIKRGEEMRGISVTPAQEGDEPARLGVVLGDAGIVRFPWYIAIYKGFAAAAFGAANIVVAFYILIKNLIIGQGLAFEVSGPVGIAVVVGQSARLGIQHLISVTAMISLSLAVINILPIPALDGGRALFVVIEKIIGRPVPMKYEQMAHTTGFLLLMLLILVVTVRDVAGLF